MEKWNIIDNKWRSLIFIESLQIDDGKIRRDVTCNASTNILKITNNTADDIFVRNTAIAKLIGSELMVSLSLLFSFSIEGHLAIGDIVPKHTFIATPSPDSYSMKNKIDIVSLNELSNKINNMTVRNNR